MYLKKHFTLTILFCCTVFAVLAQSVIQPYKENSRYWQYQGSPIFLFGGSDNDNLWQWKGEKLTKHLELLASLGGNYVRNTMSDRDEGDIYAFKQLEDGKYDLEQWNEAYWEQLEFFLEETAQRDIIVQLTVWDWFDLSGPNFDRHPLNPSNNVNWEAGLIKEREDFYGGSLYDNNQPVLDLQHKYVEKLLSISFGYDHILYNVGNESSLGAEWENYWAETMKNQAASADKQIYLTSMQLVPSNGVRHVLTYRSLYDFAEISQNNQDSKGARGRKHYENVLAWGRLLESDPGGIMPMNNEKIYGSADGRNYSAGHGKEAEDRFWKNVFGGAASVRFHRSEGYWGIGLSERAQKNIKAMSMFLDSFDVFRAKPYGEIKFIGDSEAYAMAELGKTYAVYFPVGRQSIELDPYLFAKKVSVRFLDIDDGEWMEEEVIDLEWEEELSDMFGFQKGISLTTPENKACVAIVKILE
ncbi:hypothetical protein [Pleomorphovibrio marinus]|uniref:hypothetical protein n=1 Tax=Pleomorphovibrio marinus TaxID=2164132 RepID=UPI001300A0F1|nr:hypothetical protein [Pleomorphovibrio marinus]